MDENQDPTQDSLQTPRNEDRKNLQGYTRLAASLVLVVATPLLMLTGLALALFFAAPQRFDSLMARLPGEAALRSVMVFAPAALVAIIVLAVLYAVEPDVVEAERPIVSPRSDPARDIAENVVLQQLSGWFLPFSIPLFLLMIAIRAAAFLSPSRFDNLLSRLPGDRLLAFLLGPGLLILLVLIAVAIRMTFGRPENETTPLPPVFVRTRQFLISAGPARLAVGSMLSFSIPLLILSLIALTGFQARPGRVLDLLLQLPKETVLRLGLLFAPTSLFIVVSLGVLFMIRRTIGEERTQSATDLSFLIQQYGSWALLGGLLIASAVIVGVVVGMLVLLLR